MEGGVCLHVSPRIPDPVPALPDGPQQSQIELATKVAEKCYNHGKGPYSGAFNQENALV